jgi:hypothetical protein
MSDAIDNVNSTIGSGFTQRWPMSFSLFMTSDPGRLTTGAASAAVAVGAVAMNTLTWLA